MKSVKITPEVRCCCRYLRMFLIFSLVFLFWGCASMDVQETYYVAVPSGKNTNYYRIRITGRALMGDAQYDAAWFSSNTIDNLYSNVTNSNAAESINLEKSIKQGLTKQYEKTHKAYLIAAANPQTSDAEITQWMKILRRLRAAPSSKTPLPAGGLELEFNPLENLITRRSGQKLVMVLSSNPGTVINEIKGFAEADKTSAAILRMAKVVEENRDKNNQQEVAKVEAADGQFLLISNQLNNAIIASENADKQQLIQQMTTLLILAENLK